MEAAKGSFDEKLISNVLGLQVRSIFAAMREVGMNIGSIDFDQKIDFILHSVDGYSLRASIDGCVLLG